MKKLVNILLFSSMLLFVGCGSEQKGESESKGIYYGDFAITELPYEPTSNWDEIVQEIFGSSYRVADWNDLEKFYYEKDGNLLSLFDGLKFLKKYNTSASIKRDGDKNWSSSRFYYVTRHEHNKPGNYLDHEDIDNNLISLGSWGTSWRILAVKKSFK